MTILSFLPEIYLLILLFCSLISVNFKMFNCRPTSAVIALVATAGLVYFVCRPDIAYYQPALKILYSDSLAYFGKILSLLTLIVFSLGFHFHRGLGHRARQTSNLFTLFYAFFTIALFQANHLVLFIGSALGLYFTSINLVLIESDRSESWVKLFRHRALPLALWAIVSSLLFGVGAWLFGSVYFSDWMLTLGKHNGGDIGLFIVGFLILMVSAIPLSGMRFQGRAPLGISALVYGIFMIVAAFWLRLGVPFFNISGLLAKVPAQTLISAGLGIFALRYSWQTMRTRDHHRWYSSALPTSVALSLFLVLLTSDQALPAFYCISISLLFTFALISHAFLDDQYRHKALLVVSLIALIGAPPLILGEQFYRLVHDAVLAGNLVAGILIMASWFAFTLAGMQMIGKILLIRNGIRTKRGIQLSEVFFVGIYLICVIGLTAFRPAVVALLNEHPLFNLW